MPNCFVLNAVKAKALLLLAIGFFVSDAGPSPSPSSFVVVGSAASGSSRFRIDGSVNSVACFRLLEAPVGTRVAFADNLGGSWRVEIGEVTCFEVPATLAVAMATEGSWRASVTAANGESRVAITRLSAEDEADNNHYDVIVNNRTQCKSLEFACHSGQQCIPISFYCNGRLDCFDGSDELNCQIGDPYGWLMARVCIGAGVLVCFLLVFTYCFRRQPSPRMRRQLPSVTSGHLPPNLNSDRRVTGLGRLPPSYWDAAGDNQGFEWVGEAPPKYEIAVADCVADEADGDRAVSVRSENELSEAQPASQA